MRATSRRLYTHTQEERALQRDASSRLCGGADAAQGADVRVSDDGSLLFYNGDEFVASFKNYVWCMDDAAMPRVAPPPVSRLRQ